MRSKPWVSKFIWHRATPFFVGWLAGHTWKNNNKWYTLLPKLLCNFYDIYTVYKFGREPHTTYGQLAAGWRPTP